MGKLKWQSLCNDDDDQPQSVFLVCGAVKVKELLLATLFSLAQSFLFGLLSNQTRSVVVFVLRLRPFVIRPSAGIISDYDVSATFSTCPRTPAVSCSAILFGLVVRVRWDTHTENG